MFGRFDTAAFAVAVAVFVLGCLAAWAMKRYAVTDSIGFVALIVLPLIAYGIVSGDVAKVSAPGGWAAEFRSVALARISPTRLVEEVRKLELVSKAGITEIDKKRASIRPGQPVAITLQLGRKFYYTEQAIADYIQAFIMLDPNLTIVFEDENDQFVASANANSILAALNLRGFDQKMLNALQQKDILTLRRLVVLTTNSASDETTNSEALKMMLKDGVESLVKVDESGKASGIVRREEIISRLMVKLSNS